MTGCGSGRPLTTLRRYSGIWSAVSGVPCARRRTACLGTGSLRQFEVAHHTDHGLDVFYRRVGNNAVAEVEDVAWTAGGGVQDFVDALFQHFRRSEEGDGIEIALHRMAVPDGAPAFVEGLPPIEADDVGSGGSHGAEKSRCLDAEVDYRHAQFLHGADEAFGSLESIVAVVGGAERADPTVEDLDDISAGLHLQAAVLGQYDDQLVQEQAPRERIAIHHCLGVDVIA